MKGESVNPAVLKVMWTRAYVESKIRGTPFKDMLQALLAEAEGGKQLPDKIKSQSQAGRQTHKPSVLEMPAGSEWSIFTEELECILKDLNAPPQWSNHLAFIVNACLFPNVVLETQGCARFGFLYHKSPDIFLSVLQRVRELIKEKIESKDALAMLVIASDKLFWNVKADVLGPLLGTTGRHLVNLRGEVTRRSPPNSYPQSTD